ncbi:MAG: RCC1 domain-containing protein, partial [Bdellovibrionales bacterium]
MKLKPIQLLFFILGISFTAPALATQPSYQIWLGTYHGCGIDDTGFRCWGYNARGQSNSNVRIGNVRQVTLGEEHTCALDEQGVLCWGDNEEGQSEVPALRNPRYISAANNSTCAVDDDGVKCWGGDSKDENGKLNAKNFPPLKNPTSVHVYWNGVCAVHDEGLTCWKEYAFNKGRTVPAKNVKAVSADMYRAYAMTDTEIISQSGRKFSVKNPQQFVTHDEPSGVSAVCVLDDNGVTCWHDKDNAGAAKMPIPPLKNPRQIAVGDEQICALDDDGVTCWGSIGQYDDALKAPQVMTNVPKLQNPQKLLNGRRGVCATDMNGLTCWGRIGENTEFKVVNTKLSFAWYEMESFLENLVATNSPNRGKYFADMLAFYQSVLKHDYFIEFQSLVMDLLQPSVESVDSEYFQTTVIPAFQKLHDGMNADIARKKLEIQDSELSRQACLKSLEAVLNVASEFLSPEDRQNILPVIRAIGVATNDPNDKAVKQVLTKIQGAQPT